MKKLACIFLLVLMSAIGLAQEKHHPYDFNVEIGVNYQPFQYLGVFRLAELCRLPAENLDLH